MRLRFLRQSYFFLARFTQNHASLDLNIHLLFQSPLMTDLSV